MNATPVLLAARTRLTIPAPGYAVHLHAYRNANRAHLAPWEPARPPGYFTLEAARLRLDMSLAEARAGTALHFLAFDRDSDILLATCSFTNIVRGVLQGCNLGFSVAAAHQGKGLMGEVVAAGIAHMFEAEQLHRIMACHMPSNLRSAALLARLGFEREGLARSYLKIDGRWEDMVLTSLIHPD
jgi:ribosomal-protein-alanine N-acetyltransferase